MLLEEIIPVTMGKFEKKVPNNVLLFQVPSTSHCFLHKTPTGIGMAWPGSHSICQSHWPVKMPNHPSAMFVQLTKLASKTEAAC